MKDGYNNGTPSTVGAGRGASVVERWMSTIYRRPKGGCSPQYTLWGVRAHERRIQQRDPLHCRGMKGGKRCRTLEVNHLSAAEGGLLSSVYIMGCKGP